MGEAPLTTRERACLVFLNKKTEATAAMIGKAIAPGGARSPRGYAMIGHGEARRLNLDTPASTAWLPEMKAYRITAHGRSRIAPPVFREAEER